MYSVHSTHPLIAAGERSQQGREERQSDRQLRAGGAELEREAGGLVRVGISSVLRRFGKAWQHKPEPLELVRDLPKDAVKMQILIL